jgi:hypothetical protein
MKKQIRAFFMTTLILTVLLFFGWCLSRCLLLLGTGLRFFRADGCVVLRTRTG